MGAKVQVAGGEEFEAPSSPSRVAFLCFYPDWGHILPLLKIAKAAQDGGHVVRCYFPERGREMSERYGVSVFTLKVDNEAGDEVRKSLGSRSIFFLNFSGYGHTTLLIDPPILRSSVTHLDDVFADVESFAPDVVVGDAHILAPVYERIAQTCGAQYVRNDPSGTLAHLYRRFISVYGGARASKTAMSAVEFAGSLFGAVYRPAFYLRHLSQWRKSRAIKEELRTKLEAHAGGNPSPSWFLTAGLTWIEEHFLADAPNLPAQSRRVDLPPLPSAPEALSSELEEWLSTADEPVVYISFGSILGLREETYRKMAEGLRQSGCRIIWSTPLGETGVLKELAKDPKFHITKYVPQAELLKRKELACFVTHSGAGSVQEALIGGVPLLCVPLHADNGYISWLIERLGVGRRIWKHQLGKPAFVAAVRDLLRITAYKKRATEIAEVLRSTDAERDAAAFLTDVARSGDRKRIKSPH